MKRRLSGPYLLLLALGLLSCTRHPDASKRSDGSVLLEEPGYSIEMPAPFTKQVQEEKLGRVSIYLSKARSGVFEMAYSDNLGVPLSADEILDTIQAQYVGSDAVVERASIELDGHPGRSLEITGRGLTRYLRLYSVGRRAYHISVLSRAADASPGDAQRFFDTFKLATDSKEPE